MTTPTPTPEEPGTGQDLVADLVWRYVLAMVVPLWTPVANTAPVTAFNYDAAFKALEARHGSPIAPPSNAHDLVVLQARRMAEDAHRQATAEKRRAEEAEGLALEDQRAKARLAAKEEAQRMREQERVRQAQKEAEDIGDFGL